MDSTPWGFIHQKKKTEEALSDVHHLEAENEKLRKIIKKLLGKQSLSDEDKTLLDKV